MFRTHVECRLCQIELVGRIQVLWFIGEANKPQTLKNLEVTKFGVSHLEVSHTQVEDHHGARLLIAIVAVALALSAQEAVGHACVLHRLDASGHQAPHQALRAGAVMHRHGADPVASEAKSRVDMTHVHGLLHAEDQGFDPRLPADQVVFVASVYGPAIELRDQGLEVMRPRRHTEDEVCEIHNLVLLFRLAYLYLVCLGIHHCALLLPSLR